MILAGLLATGSIALAFEPPDLARIRNTQGPRLRVQLGGIDVPSEAVQPNQTELRKYKDTLQVPGNDRSWAGLVLLNSQEQLINNTDQTLVMAGPDKTPTEYRISCEASVGQVTIGYPQRDSPCDRGLLASSSPERLYSQLHNKAQNSFNQLQYCSALSSSTKAWGFGYTQGGIDPCQRAIETCQADMATPDCLVISWGEWNAADLEIMATLSCDNLLTMTRQGGGEEVFTEWLPLMETRGRFSNRENCVIKVYQADEILIVPASKEEAPLFQVNRLEDGSLGIDVMVGAIKIISQKRPQGGTIPKGLSYRQNEDKVFPLNCPAKQASPSMTAFLDQNTWLNAQTPSSEVSQQLQTYRDQFCQTTPTPNLSNPEIRIFFDLIDIFNREPETPEGKPPNRPNAIPQ